MSASSSIVFKADQRAPEQSPAYRKYACFNADDPGYPLREPFGDLLYLDDVYLGPGQQNVLKQDQHLYQIILPLAGIVVYNDALLQDERVHSEEMLLLSNQGEATIRNPFDEETINYLHIGFRKWSGLPQNMVKHHLDLENYGQLTSLDIDKTIEECYACIGVYRGRTKGQYRRRYDDTGVFAYVINGAFEVEDRLMEHRDGLALWDINTIHFEALSEFAILLLLEVPIRANN